MNNFRCKHCRQLQFKYELKGDTITIEVKCYACNAFSTFVINLSSLINNKKIYLDEQSNK